MKDNTSLSRYISLILRHHPEAAGINLDSHGWANVEELIDGINKTRKFDLPTLEQIVATDKKGRYSFSEDKKFIRANQGHSVKVDVELDELEPPEILYHGTGKKFTAKIDSEGLKPEGRLYVHLSIDYETAEKVGSRHGKPVIYAVSSGKMFREGYKFFKSVNGVWLTEKVPVEFLNKRAQANKG